MPGRAGRRHRHAGRRHRSRWCGEDLPVQPGPCLHVPPWLFGHSLRAQRHAKRLQVLGDDGAGRVRKPAAGPVMPVAAHRRDPPPGPAQSSVPDAHILRDRDGIAPAPLESREPGLALEAPLPGVGPGPERVADGIERHFLQPGRVPAQPCQHAARCKRGGSRQRRAVQARVNRGTVAGGPAGA